MDVFEKTFLGAAKGELNCAHACLRKYTLTHSYTHGIAGYCFDVLRKMDAFEQFSPINMRRIFIDFFNAPVILICHNFVCQ